MDSADGMDVSPPPRAVTSLTSVPGHKVELRSGRPASCECGGRQPGPSQDPLAPTRWREEHLRSAWPVLIGRLEGEAVEGWLTRIHDAHAEASEAELRAFDRDGGSQPIPPGGKYPTISPEYVEASDRVEVLQHQMDEVQELVLGRRPSR